MLKERRRRGTGAVGGQGAGRLEVVYGETGHTGADIVRRSGWGVFHQVQGGLGGLCIYMEDEPTETTNEQIRHRRDKGCQVDRHNRIIEQYCYEVNDYVPNNQSTTGAKWKVSDQKRVRGEKLNFLISTISHFVQVHSRLYFC